jgi:hypothetical protein
VAVITWRPAKEFAQEKFKEIKEVYMWLRKKSGK